MKFSAGNIENELKEIEKLESENESSAERITSNGGILSIYCC